MLLSLTPMNLGLSQGVVPPIYTATMGTACVFIAGLATATYGGLGLINPVTPAGSSAIKLVPLKCSFVPTGVGTAGNFLGLSKIYGTNSVMGTSGAPGPVWQAGVAGTTTNQRAVILGTFTMSNGTCTNAYVEFLMGGGATAGSPNAGMLPLDGEITVMPGEVLTFNMGIAGTGIASITWAELPL